MHTMNIDPIAIFQYFKTISHSIYTAHHTFQYYRSYQIDLRIRLVLRKAKFGKKYHMLPAQGRVGIEKPLFNAWK